MCRALLQITSNDTTQGGGSPTAAPSWVATPPARNYETILNCGTSVCTVIMVMMISGFGLLVILALGPRLYRKWRYKSALRRGQMPANLLISSDAKWDGDRGDVAVFNFIVRRPRKKGDVQDESCSICFKKNTWYTPWVVFKCNHGVCNTCFKKLVDEKRLNAACPLCRTLLAEGQGNRGDHRPQRSNSHISTSATATPALIPATTTTERLEQEHDVDGEVLAPPAVEQQEQQARNRARAVTTSPENTL